MTLRTGKTAVSLGNGGHIDCSAQADVEGGVCQDASSDNALCDVSNHVQIPSGLPTSFTSTKAKRKAAKNKGSAKRNKIGRPRELDPADLENYAEEFAVSQVLRDFKPHWTILDPPEERLRGLSGNEAAEEEVGVDVEDERYGDERYGDEGCEDEICEYEECEDEECEDEGCEDDSSISEEKHTNEDTCTQDTYAQDTCTQDTYTQDTYTQDTHIHETLQPCTRENADANESVTTSPAPHMHRYYQQRYDFFSRFDCGIDMGAGDEGWWSVTPELIAAHTAREARFIVDNDKDPVVIDAFAGIGGNAIQFALAGFRVVAVELDEGRLAAARNNATVYGVADQITFIQGDAFDILRQWKEPSAKIKDAAIPSDMSIDLVFLSPPWGGPEYLKQERYFFDSQGCLDGRGAELFKLARSLTPHVILYLPRQTCLDTFAHFLRLEDIETESERSHIEIGAECSHTESEHSKEEAAHPAIERGNDSFVVEQHWLRNRLKALSLYFYPK
jgi:16S rRNA G966 N2-methylase RsmD